MVPEAWLASALAGWLEPVQVLPHHQMKEELG